MGLNLYDENKVLFGDDDVLRTFHNGFLGGSLEKKFYIRNDDPTRYYTNLNLTYTVTNYDDLGEFGTTGWSVKFIEGERRPTESNWDSVRSGEPLALADIGSTEAADTHTYRPIWVRVFCPGGEEAQIRENQLIQIQGMIRLVGA